MTASLLDNIVRSAPGSILDQPVDIIVVSATNERYSIPLARQFVPGERETFADLLQANPVADGVFVSELPFGDIAAMLVADPPAFSSATPWSLELMEMTAPASAVRADIDVAALAAFLNGVGRSGIDADIDDLQFRATVRALNAGDDLTVTGFVADIDRPILDPAAEPFEVGAHVPVAAFATENGGARFVYAYAQQVTADAPELRRRHDLLVGQVGLAFRGMDPASERRGQRQYVPSVWRTTKGPRRQVERSAVQLSFEPLDLLTVRPALPGRVENLLGLRGGPLSPAERDEVRAFLMQIGTPLVPGRNELYARCPLKVHGSRKAYVNAHASGGISVVCLGGHGGSGRHVWHERELLDLARGGSK